MAKREKKYEYHEFVTETESAKEANFDYKIEEESILFDLKVLLREYYAATFTAEGDALKLQFNNGQTFILSVKEVEEEN